jgi:Uma2 family endonuclease
LLLVDEATESHEHIVAALIAHLYLRAQAGKFGRVYASGYKVRVDQRRRHVPDVRLYRPGSTETRETRGVSSDAPDLATEVIAPSSHRHDRVTKPTSYASIGLPEDWVGEPAARTLGMFLKAAAAS